MTFAPSEIAGCLLARNTRARAIEIVEVRIRETFLFKPAVSAVWRDVLKILEAST